MAHHEEVIVAVDNGEMRMQKEEGGEWNYAVLGKGFCMVANNRVTVLADTVERPEEVDANRAKEALDAEDYNLASDIQVELQAKREELRNLYLTYKNNLF